MNSSQEAHVYTANFGYRDVSARQPPTENTTYVIGSLTKGITAALLGQLVDADAVSWSTQLHTLVPYTRDADDPAANITLEDLLSHRSGLPGYNAYWLQSGNTPVLPRREAVRILSAVPAAAPVRTAFVYNNLAYEVAGQVLERLAGAPYAKVLARVTDALGMRNTWLGEDLGRHVDTAKAYATLRNGSAVEIPLPLRGSDSLIGAAAGIRSCVSDLLELYRGFMAAGNSALGLQTTRGGGGNNNPLRQLPTLWKPHIALPFPSLREYTYALGWVRAELPTQLSFTGPDTVPPESPYLLPPIVGFGAPSRLALVHSGNLPGSVAYAALFPESSAAVVVLANSVALTDTARLVAGVLIDALFAPSDSSQQRREERWNEHISYARVTAEAGKHWVERMARELHGGKTVRRPVRPLHAYTGRYWNGLGNFYIDVRVVGNALQVLFLGTEDNAFALEPWRKDSFFWLTTDHDGLAAKARYTTWSAEYYVLSFGCARKGAPGCLVWKHEAAVAGDGEVFWKDEQMPRQRKQLQTVVRS